MLMHRPVPLIFVGNIMEDGWYGLATRVLFEYLSLSYSITRISAYHDYFRISWIILKLCQGIMATVNLTGFFVARRWSDKTGLCRLHVRTSCLAHGCGLVLQLDNPPNHSKPMKLMIFLVMQDSCTSREYHCLLHFRWSQGPSLAPATWSPPSPRPTPSTHSGKPLANLHGATAFSRSLGHKRSYIREMNV